MLGEWDEVVANPRLLPDRLQSALRSDFDSRKACQKLQDEAYISARRAGKMSQIFQKLVFCFPSPLRRGKGQQ